MSDEFAVLDATEKAGIGATLNRCRALAAKIGNELRNKRHEHIVGKLSLADFCSSLEHAADVVTPAGAPTVNPIVTSFRPAPTTEKADPGVVKLNVRPGPGSVPPRTAMT